MITDPISDMLTRIRNAQGAEKLSVAIPASTMKQAILKVMQQEGYIERYTEQQVDSKAVLEVFLKYYAGRPVIGSLRRVSRPGRRVYKGKDEIVPVAGGLGIAIVSTSRGVMSDNDARKAGIGGEVLCIVS
jgi:small subunit ribosomal protein S8